MPPSPNVRAYALAWDAFIVSKEPLSEESVPWPPSSPEGALGIDCRSSSSGAVKKAFRKFALRWHPDKFLQKFGARFKETPSREQVVVMARVTALFQKVCGDVG